MISAFVAGGVTNDKTETDFDGALHAFESAITDVGKFIVTEYVPVVLALGALYPSGTTCTTTSPR